MHNEIINKIAEIEALAIDGEIECSKAYISLKAIEKRLEHALENINPHAINEINRVGINNKYHKYGATIQYVQSGKYDFSNVKIVAEKEIELKYIQDKIKKLHETQQNGEEMLIDVNTGEIYERPIYKANKPSLKVIFDKK